MFTFAKTSTRVGRLFSGTTSLLTNSHHHHHHQNQSTQAAPAFVEPRAAAATPPPFLVQTLFTTKMPKLFHYTHAIVSGPTPSLAKEAIRLDAKMDGLFLKDLGPVDMEECRREHARYVKTLEDLGLKVLRLPPVDATPDCVFVEDPVVVVNGRAFITRPGADSRRAEAPNMKKFLENSGLKLEIVDICGEGETIDGGDVLFAGKEFFVGISTRTNAAGVAALQKAFPEFPVHGVTVDSGLHLKTLSGMVQEGVLMIGDSKTCRSAVKQIKEKAKFPIDFLIVPEDDAANCLLVNGTIVYRGEEYPKSAAVLDARFPDVPKKIVTNRELMKVDGSLTCCSVLMHLG